jgi:RNA polymerase sigma factor (sigma-70 family)
MALGALAGIIPLLRHAEHATASDAELLERFVSTRDAAAFEALVRRHGPMVFAVCCRILRRTQDAEDAFQATFLVLVHKAASVSPRNKLAAWLHGVARKTSLKARQRATRRTEVESQVPARSTGAMPPDPACGEAELLLDQELAGLPDRYRLPIILCDLEGRLRTEVAGTLGCSEGTLSSRLTRGRRLLAERLKRRGVHLSVGALVAILTERSPALAELLLRSLSPAALIASHPSVAQLATGVMKSMFLKKLQSLAMAAVFTIAATFALTGTASKPTQAAPVPATPTAPAVDEKALNESLADADGQLLLNRQVLKDLKCDIDQLYRIMDSIEAAQAESMKKTNEAMAQLNRNAAGNPMAFQQMFKEMYEAGIKDLRESTKDVAIKLLTAAQRKRFREIDLQARGCEVFLSPSVAKALQLTEKQKEQMAENAKQVDEDIQQSFQKQVAPNVVVHQVDPKQIMESRNEGMKRALAILTDEQKAGWKKMTGDPIAYQIDRPWTGGIRGVPVLPGGGANIAPGKIPVVPAVPAPVPPPARNPAK